MKLLQAHICFTPILINQYKEDYHTTWHFNVLFFYLHDWFRSGMSKLSCSV